MTSQNKFPNPRSAWMTGIIILLVVAILIVAALIIGELAQGVGPNTNTREGIHPPRQDTATPFPGASRTPAPTVTPRPTATATFTATPSRTPTPTASPTPTFTPTPTPLPPLYWEELGYLTSIEYTTSTVVEKERTRSGLGALLGTDHVLLTAVGRIQMGVDLGQIDDSDVDIDGTAITVTLPRAMVISVELLPEESQIYASDRSWLFSEYEGLEVAAMEQARQQLLDQANNNEGMSELAETLARLQLIEFLRSVGYEKIEILFVEAE